MPQPDSETRWLKALRSQQMVIVATFFASEVLWFSLGIRFDTSDRATTPLEHYVQYVEPALLRERFWESLFYLHVQPPLYQAYLGAVVQSPEPWWTPLFSLSYSAMALALVLAARALLADIGLSPRACLAASVLLIFSPPLVLVAKWLYVPLPVAALLVVAALMLHRAAARGGTGYFAAYGSALAAIALITSYFHLLWLVVMLGLGALAARDDRGRLGAKRLAALVVPLIVVVSVYAKNLAVFGTFTAATWSNVAPSRTARDSVGPAVLERLIGERRVSHWMRRDLQTHLQIDELPRPKTGIAVLDQPRRRSGSVNWNYDSLRPVYQQLGKDASYIARHDPLAWLRHAGKAFTAYQAPATWSQYAVGRNREKIRRWSECFEQYVWGAALGRLLHRAVGALGWVTFPTLLAPLLLAYGARTAMSKRALPAQRATAAFLVLNLAYVAALAIGVADNEYERYHFFSDALLYLLACWGAAAGWRWVSSR